MGTSTLIDRASGQTILDSFFNSIHSALNGDFVGRNTSGVATLGQNLGTNAIPWGVGYITSLILNGSAVDTSQLTAPKNRIVSGDTRSTSNQPQFIDPNGAAASFVLTGLTVNLVLDIDGSTVTVSTDITKSSLTVGPSTTETCLVNSTIAADGENTRTWGEIGSQEETLPVDTMGAEFQAEIGQWKAIKIAGVATEYALAFVKSATELTNIKRGYFTDSSGDPINRTTFTNNDPITVLSTGWVFVENDGATVDVSYTNPIRSFTAPSGPATGDYWYDMANRTWKRYDGASFQIISRTLVGVVGIDSANCVCARSFDIYAKYQDINNIELEINSTEIIQTRGEGSKMNVAGMELEYGFNHESWNITTDLASSVDMYNATEQASTIYYLYLKDTGDTVISDISPLYEPEKLGEYHPHNPWRLVGYAYNDGSSNLVTIIPSKPNSDWINYGPIEVSAVTTPPTKGAITLDSMKFRKVGDSIEMHVTYEQSGGGGAGSGFYLFGVPEGFFINTNRIQASVTPGQRQIVGSSRQGASASDDILEGHTLVYNTNYLVINTAHPTSAQLLLFVSTSAANFGTAGMQLGFNATIPIRGFRSIS